MLNNIQIEKIKQLQKEDICQIFDILLQNVDFEIKEYFFNELIENLGVCDIKTYSEINMIDLSNVSVGIYFLVVGDNVKQTFKVIKN